MHRRPGCVTAYAVLLGAGAGLMAIGGMIGGILALGDDVAAGLVLMAVSSVLAILYFLLARGLWNMRNWARIIIIIFQILGVLISLLQISLKIVIGGSISAIELTAFIFGLAMAGYVIYWFASHGEYFRE